MTISWPKHLGWVLAVSIPVCFGTNLPGGRPDSKIGCTKLAESFPGKTFFPSSAQYLESRTSYFSNFENEVSPECIFQPTSSSDVAAAVKLFRDEKFPANGHRTKIAIRGGGHTAWAGAANIENGATIDMRNVSGVSLNELKTVASIGAGETWGNVYKALEPTGFAVSGGRVSIVGVGGLITGGGLSYFSGMRGFVCDGVVNFEVVLASGQIINANADENTDLFIALKGGSNNFGIVTRFDLSAFPQTGMWGGAIFSPSVTMPAYLQEFFDFLTSPTTDEAAHVIVSTTWLEDNKTELVGINLYDVKGRTNLDSLKPFVDVPNQIQNTLREDTLLSFTNEQASFNKPGERQLMFVTGYKPDLNLILDVYRLWQKKMETLAGVKGLAFTMIFQPLTLSTLSKSTQITKGGNSLGLDGSRSPLVLNHFNIVHLNAADDQKVVDASLALIAEIEELAINRGLRHPYRFTNYAYKGQKVLEGYGSRSLAHLRAVSRKYDPSQFFQKRVPGGFKLADAKG